MHWGNQVIDPDFLLEYFEITSALGVELSGWCSANAGNFEHRISGIITPGYSETS